MLLIIQKKRIESKTQNREKTNKTEKDENNRQKMLTYINQYCQK